MSFVGVFRNSRIKGGLVDLGPLLNAFRCILNVHFSYLTIKNSMNNHQMFTCISYSSTSQVESIQEKQCDKFTLLSVFQLTDMKVNQQVLTTRKGLTNAQQMKDTIIFKDCLKFIKTYKR